MLLFKGKIVKYIYILEFLLNIMSNRAEKLSVLPSRFDVRSNSTKLSAEIG